MELENRGGELTRRCRARWDGGASRAGLLPLLLRHRALRDQPRAVHRHDALLDELNEALDWSLPKQDYETVAGLVLATLHRIPRTGEEFQIPGYTITVLEADARRVGAVKITPVTAPTPTAGAV